MATRSLHVLCFASLLAFAVACGENQNHEPVRPDAGPDAELDAGATDAGTTDAGDAGTEADGGPDCAAHPCDCCAPNQVCVDAQCCTPNCEGKACGSDGCGGSCTGTCAEGWTCNPSSGACECATDDDRTFCQKQGVACGTASGVDNCGGQRTGVECDLCVAPAICDRAAGACRCVPESDTELCTALGKSCGELQTQDHCGATRTIQCGSCNLGFLCGPSNVCLTCLPDAPEDFCAAHSKTCGLFSGLDNCHEQRVDVNCGSCAPGSLCDPATNTCVACSSETDTAFCARLGGAQPYDCGTVTDLDNCNLPRTVSCGSCPAPQLCDTTNHCRACVAQTDEDFCLEHSAQCGAVTALDNCLDERTVANCGSCNSGEVCQTNQCELCTPETDTAFCARLNKNCGAVNGTDNCGVPRPVPDCGSCTSPRVCTSLNFCGNPGAPLNDECWAPEVVALTAHGATLTGTAHGDTTTAVDGATSTCLASGGGFDLVYKFTVPAGPNVAAQIVATPSSGSALRPSLSLRNACDSRSNEITCGYTPVPGGTVTLRARTLAPGDYFVWVDSTASSAAGPFDLTVTLTPAPAAPSNDTCSAPTPLALVNGTVTVDGDTLYAGDNYTGSCGALTGGDVVYQLDLATASEVWVSVTRGEASPEFAPAVYLRSACAGGGGANQPACRTDINGTASFVLHDLGAGTWYLVVDGTAATSGTFTLTVTVGPPVLAPENDLCAAPTPLVFPRGATSVSVDGTTLAGVNDSTGSCAAMDGPEVVYAFELTTLTTVTAVVTRDAATPGYVPAVYFRFDCTSNAGTNEKACGFAPSGGTAATAVASNLGPGIYHVIVDGTGGTEGSFTLDLLLGAPAANSTCAAALPLSVDPTTHTVTVVGDNRVGNDTVVSSCKSSSTGKDVVYSFAVGATHQNATIVVTPMPGSTIKLNPSVRRDCAAIGSELACTTTGAVGASANLKLDDLATGTYYIWVDSIASNIYGPFSLTLRLEDTPAAPANDACAAAQVVAIDTTTGVGTASGTTESATGDSHGFCRSSGSGGEVVYKFNLAATSAVDIAVTPKSVSGLRPVLYVRSDCAVAATESQCIGAGAAGYPAELGYSRLAAGDYYVVVDSYDAASTGAFDLTITTRAPGPAPANDLCAAATPMPAFDPITRKSTLTGSTLDATDTDASQCSTTATPLDGADLAYSFVLAADAKVTVRATRDAGSPLFRPAVSIRRTCAPSEEVACALETAGVATVTSSLSAGTWFVLVDGVAGSFGGFTLDVIEMTASAAPGDTCGNPLPLTFVNNVATVTDDLRASGAKHDYLGSCNKNMGGPDLVYSFDLATSGTVFAEIGPTPNGSNVYPSVYLRHECASAVSEAACKYGNSTANFSFTSPRLSPGRYYVFADSFSQAYAGPFVLTVTFTPTPNAAPTNDTCAGAIALAFRDGAAHRTGDTRDAADDYEGSGACGTYTTALTGGDVVYSMTVAQGETVTASVARDASTPGYYPAVYLRSTCGSALQTDQLGCYTTAVAYGVAGVTAKDLDAGTYYVVVDGQQGTTGAFALDVYKQPAPPTNTSCTAAKPLQFSNVALGVDVAEAMGDTSQGVSATAGITQNGQSCASSGSELYYAFTTTAVKDLKVDVTPLTAGYQPTVYLRSNCADSASQVVCGVNTAGAVTVAKLKLAAGSYTLVVDTSSASYNGPFRMEVKLSDPPPPPRHDTCADPQLIALPASGAAPLRLSDDTGNGNDNYTGACAVAAAPFDGPDFVYTFTLTASTQVTATVTPTAAGYKPAVYIRTGCDTPNNDVCKYNGTGGPTNPATVNASLTAGTYYLIVDGVAGSFGGFTLDVSTDDSKYLLGDHCMNAIALAPKFLPAPTGGVTATVTGDTTRAMSDTDGSCASPSGGDFFYAFSVATESVVAVTVQPDTSGGPSSYASDFYIRRVCTDTTTQMICMSTSANNAAKSGRVIHVAPGTYYLVVDATTAAANKNGPFKATITITDNPPTPLNDVCSGATPLALTGGSTPQTVTLQGEDSAFAFDNYSGTCGPSIGPEMVYSFTTTVDRSLTARVIPNATWSPTYKPVVYLRSACDQSASTNEVACTKVTTGGATATLKVNSMPAGAYYLVVDADLTTGAEAFGGLFDLSVALDPPVNGPANDTCFSAQPIALTGGIGSTTQVSGTTLNALDNGWGECGAQNAGADVVFSFVLTTPAKVTAKVIPDAGFAPAVYLRSDCGGNYASHEVACAYTSTGGQAVTATANALHPGTYFVWVDAGSTFNPVVAAGFQLELALLAPAGTPPANDTCDGVIALDLGVPVTGDTTYATNDYDWGWSNKSGCQPQTYGYSGWGAELVYAYTPSASGPFTVSVSGTGTGCDPEVWVGAGGACGDPRSCIAGRQTSSNPETIAVANGVAGTTYWIYPEPYTLSATCQLTVTVTSP